MSDMTPEQVALSFTGECEPASLGICANHRSPLGGATTCLHVLHLSELIRARDEAIRADEWVEVDEWPELPEGARVRHEWALARGADSSRRFVHRDDLPDPDADAVERMAKAIFESHNDRWEGWSEDVQEHYRDSARAALAAYRKGER